MLYANDAAENQRVLVEFGSLAGFFPTFRTAHVRNADAVGFRIHTANEFLDDLRLGSSGFDARCSGDQGRHDRNRTRAAGCGYCVWRE